MREDEFTTYVKIREKQESEPTDPTIVRMIRSVFYDTHTDVPEDRLDWVWDIVGPKVAENAGLARFTLDYKGAESYYFFPWLVQVYTSPSAALEMAYGAGYGLDGIWTNSISRRDRIDSFVRNDPTFVFNRQRQLFVADLVATVQDMSTSSAVSKVVDLGAGKMAWARWHGFGFTPEKQKIFAFDRDPTIRPDELFGEASLNELNLCYKHGDMATAFKKSECQNANLVILGGVASYYPLEVFRQNVIMPAYYLLSDNGTFFFDLQIDCPYLQRSMAIFDWPRLTLEKTAAKAIDNVERIRKELWRSGMKFSAEYALDTYNEKPSAVMITLTKI